MRGGRARRDPAARLERYGAAGKIRAYPGLKEEYYLSDFEPDPAMLQELGLDRGAPLVVVRTPPEVSLYHRFENDLFAQVLERLRVAAGEHGTQPVVLPRVGPRNGCGLRDVPGFVVPEHAIDAQSLIALADLVVSTAGGTMNREAVALGTRTRLHDLPGPAGGGRRTADRRTAPAPARPPPRSSSWASARARMRDPRVRRDPRVLVELLLSAVSDRGARAPHWHAQGRHRALTICAMRRRIRSAALPLHRHSLPQLAVDGALVAFAYYLAFQLRFTHPDAAALRRAARRHDLVGARGQPAGARAHTRLPASLALLPASATTRRS